MKLWTRKRFKDKEDFLLYLKYRFYKEPIHWMNVGSSDVVEFFNGDIKIGEMKLKSMEKIMGYFYIESGKPNWDHEFFKK